MVDAGVWFSVGVAVGLVILVVVFYVLILRRGRGLGTRGVFQRSRLHCPKCDREFDFDWFPGGSFTALRLGKSRYMQCPLCHRWSVFNIYDTMTARTLRTPSGSETPSPPRPRP